MTRSFQEDRRRGPRWVAGVMVPVMLLASLGSCTTPQTYYRDDGTPYTQNEFDAADTLITLLIIGGLAAWASAERETKRYGP